MSELYGQTPEGRPHAIKKYWVMLLVLTAMCVAVPAQAQSGNTFNSGSTGADGPFSPTTSQTITVPDSGVLNYTTVNIPSGVTISYIRNSRNTPVVILASGAVTIAGNINIDGKAASSNGGGGQNGPGGYEGGSGGYGAVPSFIGVTGDGPGGGTGGGSTSNGTNVSGGGGGGFAAAGGNGIAQNTGVTAAPGGPRYGTPALSPLIGGSGGAGGGARANSNGGGGGGGAGAILIASSSTITHTGNILARGGDGGNAPTNSIGGAGGGGGAGGAVRLVANTVSGGGSLTVTGGGAGAACLPGCYTNAAAGGSGSPGYVRIEAYDYSKFNGSATPSFISFSLPFPVNPVNAPQLKIVSVGGVAAPATPLGSLHGVPDIVVPTSTANPMAVAIEAANIPVGTVVQVTVTPAIGTRTSFQSSALGGTETASTASASIALPSGMSVITASIVIDLTTAHAQPMFMDGERVDRMEVAATFGGASEVTYVTRSGRRIKKAGE